jgi:phage I-like protein
MVDRIEQLITTLEQEINDGYNTLPDYQANNEGKTYVNGAQATLYELQKQVAELKQGLEQGKNFSLLGENV